MARGTSPTARAAKKAAAAAPKAETSAATEQAEEATVMTTVTTEAPVEETAAAEPTTEATAEATETKSDEPDLTAFQAAVEAGLTEADTSTGDVPKANLDVVVSAYRELDGVKAKNAAKKDLNDRLRDAVNAADISKAQAVMHLVDAVSAAGTSTRATAERAPADPVELFKQRLARLNLAYILVNNDVPDGKSDDEMAQIREAVTAQVGELSPQADQYYAWYTSDAEDKGDEPEVNPLVRQAVRLAVGKASGGGSKGTSTPHEGPRGNTARHIQLVFKDEPVGTFLKVAEISKRKSTEYPDKPVSPGAINSRLKSASAIEGIEAATDESGKMGARKTGDVEGL